MKQTRNIPWPRILAEGSVIVVSILLAFSIDAWWDNRQQRHNETVLLQALLDDLIEKQDTLAFRKRYNQAILDALQALINADTPGVLEPGEVDRLIGFTWWYNDPSAWDSAPMSSLVIGGDLSSVSNPELLQKLSELQLLLSGLRNLSENDQRFHNDVLVPFYIEHVSLPEIANASTHVPGFPDRPYVFPVYEISAPIDNSALLASRQFRSLLVAKTDKLIDMNGDFADFESQLQSAIEMIRTELTR
jgi:hypothetical protein